MTSWKRKNKESHKAQIFISCCTKTEKTQDSNIKDIYKNIYQSEIANEQWLKEKTEMLNEWKSSAQHSHHIRKHYNKSLDQEVKIKWIEVNVSHIIINVIFYWESYKWSKCFADTQENTKQSEMWTLIFQQKKALNTTVQRSQVQKQDDDNAITWEKDKELWHFDSSRTLIIWWHFQSILLSNCWLYAEE